MLQEFISRLEDVKGSNNQYMARCPAHDDKKASLSISTGEDGRILLNCHAGCTVREIVAAMGLKESDLFPDKRQKAFPKSVAEYDYTDAQGHFLFRKVRYEDKSFLWFHKENGRFIRKRGGDPVLYNLPVVASTTFLYIVEGEKDVETLKAAGIPAVSGADGASAGKWLPQYTEALRGKRVAIIPDNDDIGKAFAAETANALYGTAESVKVLDLTKEWPALPEKGDISDVFQMDKPEDVLIKLEALTAVTAAWEPVMQDEDPFLSCFKSLDDFTEEEASWIIPGWIPEGQITLMAADGGLGKTTIWCNIITALSSGTRCVLDPLEYKREPATVAFLTTEDSVRKKLKKKLRLAGANMHNILTPDFLADKGGLLRDLKFGSNEMERFIKHFKPVLCVFDPVQGFIPPEINMGSRNAMRDCMAPLISLGEECGTTFLIICHTNKRKGAWGRDRIADSADLWDVSRSVLMAGYTEDHGIRYLSNEKNNYSQLQETILFTINDDGQIQSEGTSWKRDREYMQENSISQSAPKRDDCKEYILHALDKAGGSIKSKELEEQVKQAGYSYITIRRAKDDLKKSGEIKYFATGFGKEKTWNIEKIGFTELSDDFPNPFDDPHQKHQDEQIKL